MNVCARECHHRYDESLWALVAIRCSTEQWFMWCLDWIFGSMLFCYGLRIYSIDFHRTFTVPLRYKRFKIVSEIEMEMKKSCSSIPNNNSIPYKNKKRPIVEVYVMIRMHSRNNNNNRCAYDALQLSSQHLHWPNQMANDIKELVKCTLSKQMSINWTIFKVEPYWL